MKRSTFFIIVVGLMFLAFTVVFVTFPRSKFSELERRELALFPEFSWERLWDGSFTHDVSTWFSDSEPFRDRLMALNMQVKDRLAWKRTGTDGEYVSFQAAAPEPAQQPSEEERETSERTPGEYKNRLTADAVAKVANAGIIIVGEGDNVRALMAYGGQPEGGKAYADIANLYSERFGDSVNVYCMVVPTAAEFYCPERIRTRIKPQLPTIRNIYSHLSPDVKAVDVYTTLGRHAAEPIYLRTDHHWSPLGAYYAAKKFAQVAKVPFRNLADHYDGHMIEGFVGTMYGYSKDISVKNAPEDFIYYTPRDTSYRATFINFALSKDFKITGESAPHQAPFFRRYKARGMAYSTFMGGDAMIVKVSTGLNTGRRLALIKDSFGNAIPGYLFGSFDEVHVLDHRYFPRNIEKYVKDNGITDFLFVNNIFNAYSDGVCRAYRRLLDN